MGQAQGLVPRKGKMAGQAGVDGTGADTDTLLTLPLPWDAVLHILSFVPGKDLIRNCRRVNSTWKEAVDNCHVWISKMDREGVAYPPIVEMTEFGLDWKKIYVLRPFGRNLLQNWDGGDDLRSWNVTHNGGDRFRMEPALKPAGSQAVPPELNCKKVWVTSYGNCSKEQTIDLIANGLDPDYLDKKQPTIEVSEWWAIRSDCAAKYNMTVMLCSATSQLPVHEKNGMYVYNGRREQWTENNWEKVTHTFTNYGPGVRRIYFGNTGKDGQYWAGHFGSKMAAPCVKILPVS